MSAVAELGQFEARAGYGVDAAGRPTYVNQYSMGSGPRDFLATQDAHNQMRARASQADPGGMVIRELLEQLKRQNLPGTAKIPVFPIAQPASHTIHYREQ